MTEVTRLLSDLAQGIDLASEQLLPLIYDELRKLAAVRMAEKATGNTLSATALVHEAYLRLVGSDDSAQWDNRGLFLHLRPRPYAGCSSSMLDEKSDLSRAETGYEARSMPRNRWFRRRQMILLVLDEALTRLAAQDAVKAEVVKLRFFSG